MHVGHDHHQHGAASVRQAAAGPGHNAPRAAQWQTPHRPAEAAPEDAGSMPEVDIDLVERAFIDGFLMAVDATSFLRLARIPFSAATADGVRLDLLRVELEALTDVAGLTPLLGGGGFRHDPLPGGAVSRRRRLRFAYFDGETVRQLPFEEVRQLRSVD